MVDFDFKKVLRNICLCHANLSVTLLDNPHLRIVSEQSPGECQEQNSCGLTRVEALGNRAIPYRGRRSTNTQAIQNVARCSGFSTPLAVPPSDRLLLVSWLRQEPTKHRSTDIAILQTDIDIRISW